MQLVRNSKRIPQNKYRTTWLYLGNTRKSYFISVGFRGPIIFFFDDRSLSRPFSRCFFKIVCFFEMRRETNTYKSFLLIYVSLKHLLNGKLRFMS